MPRLNPSESKSPPINLQKDQIQEVQENRLPFPNPIKQVQQQQQEEIIPLRTTVAAGRFFRRLFSIVFYLHLCLIAVLVIFLTIHGLISSSRTHHFHPRKWYPPLLIAPACAGLVSFTWHSITVQSPSKAIKAAFWFSPLLTCAVGSLFIMIQSPAGLALGVISIISSVILSLYACWVGPRYDYAIRILMVSTSFPPTKTTTLFIQSMAMSILYASFLISGIGGAVAFENGLHALFITIILLSLAWTMQIIKNVILVTISRVKYYHFACGADMDTNTAFRDTIKYLIGSISIGSAVIPFLSIIRGSARALDLAAGDTDEFLFSCANCYSGVASMLMMRANRWGYVYVGVYNKGFVQASVETWEMFKRTSGLEALIDSDLTGSFCFLCGVSGGAICSLATGIWALVIHKSYATELTSYAFLIGYFLCRIGMAWPQACVSAYYVAYAEDPHGVRFDSTIPVRIQELHRSQA